MECSDENGWCGWCGVCQSKFENENNRDYRGYSHEEALDQEEYQPTTNHTIQHLPE